MENLCGFRHNIRKRIRLFITSLVVPGLPIVPIKICTCEVNKIFVYIDTTSASKADCLITSLVTTSLTVLTNLRTHASITKL